MSRRPAALAALVALVASGALAACQGTPAVPELTDPREILAKSVTAMAGVRSFHVEAQLSGTIDAGLLGFGGPLTLKLDATSAEADVDVANGRTRASLVVPAPLNMDLDLIRIGDTTYLRTPFGGDLWEASVDGASGLPIDIDPAGVLLGLGAWLDRPELAPVKGGDARCGGHDCYVIEVDLSAAELARLLDGLPPDLAAAPGASVDLAVSVQKDTLRIGRLGLGIAAGDAAALELSVDVSRYDDAFSIEAPPADEVR